MCDVTENRPKTKQMQKKLIVFVVLVCIIIASLFSNMYIITHANHDEEHYETDNGCTICDHILMAKDWLRQIGAAIKIIAFVIINLFSAVAILYIIIAFWNYQTLVNLKTRMNN